MRRALTRWWIGVAVMFVLFIPHVRMYSAEATRYYTFWDRTDVAALALLLAAGGALLAGLHALACASRVQFLRRAAEAGFVIVLGVGAVGALRTGRVGSGVAWWPAATLALAVVSALLGLVALHPRLRVIPRTARGLCLALSPAVVLVLGQMLTYAEFSVRVEPIAVTAGAKVRPAALTGRTPGNVYLFIFDEWSYARTFTDDLPEELPNLARLLADATVYHDAHAPFGATRLSLPGILFQTHAEYTWAGGRPGFITGDGSVSSAERMSNAFSRMKTRGFHTHMAGFSHPYRRMFGAELDTCLAAPDGRGNDDAGLSVDDLLRHGRMAGALLAMALPKPEGAAWRVHGWCMQEDLAPRIARVAEVHERALALMRAEAPSFAVLHYPLPHDPFVFDRDGVNLELTREFPLDFGPYGRDGFVRPNPENHVARYQSNLRYLDTLLGELLAALEESGNLANATIVLTSDHTWRFDPALDELYIARGLPFRSLDFDPVPRELTHVPLIVRTPLDRGRCDVYEAVELTDLLQLLDEGHPADALGRNREYTQMDANSRRGY